MYVVRQEGKFFDFQHVLNSYFNAYVFSSFEYCAPSGCRRWSRI